MLLHMLLVLAYALITALPAAADVPQLLRRAIVTGHARGQVDGPIAHEAQRKLNATGALTLSARRVYRFEQADCARLQLDFTQQAALLPGASLPAAYHWSTQLSICADGHPPAVPARSSK